MNRRANPVRLRNEMGGWKLLASMSRIGINAGGRLTQLAVKEAGRIALGVFCVVMQSRRPGTVAALLPDRLGLLHDPIRLLNLAFKKRDLPSARAEYVRKILILDIGEKPE